MLVQYGAGVLDARGSIGGATASRNRFGNYWRARTTPINPQSDRQNIVRTSVAAIAERWSGTLTPAQRSGWEVYAANIVRTNKLGQQIKLTGFNHYIRSNVPLLQTANTLVDAPPVDLTLPGADPLFLCTVDAAGQEISVAFDVALQWNQVDEGHMFVSMSLPHNTGRNFIGGPFRLAGTLDGDTAIPLTSPQVLPVPFTVAEGQVVVCRARIIEADGRLSDTFQDLSDVVA